MTRQARLLPLIIGHRGSSAVAPENTLAAFARAMADGADGFEFDVRLARDGKPVVIHDATLQRTGRSLAAVADLSSLELGKIDVGSWFNRRHPQKARAEYAQETVPTLAQVFDLTAGGGQLLYVEMKCEKSQASDLAAAVVDLIRQYSIKDQVVVESFDLASIAEVKRLDSEVRTAALFEPRLERPTSLVRKMRTLELALDVRADELALHHTLAGKRVVDKATKAGIPVVVWTVDNPNWIKRALSLGIRALITNDPAGLLKERSRLTVI
jgi:glycerophosphoryl diester phosphodiesterase